MKLVKKEVSLYVIEQTLSLVCEQVTGDAWDFTHKHTLANESSDELVWIILRKVYETCSP